MSSVSLLSSTMWIDALQRKADEETLVLQKLTTEWQNYSRVLSTIKSNTSSTTQTMRFLQNNVMADHQRILMSSEVYYDLTQQVCVCAFIFLALVDLSKNKSEKMFKIGQTVCLKSEFFLSYYI